MAKKTYLTQLNETFDKKPTRKRIKVGDKRNQRGQFQAQRKVIAEQGSTVGQPQPSAIAPWQAPGIKVPRKYGTGMMDTPYHPDTAYQYKTTDSVRNQKFQIGSKNALGQISSSSKTITEWWNKKFHNIYMSGDVFGEKTPYDEAAGDSKRKRLQLVRDQISEAVVEDYNVQNEFWQKKGVHPDVLIELGQEELTRISGAQHKGEGKTKDIVGRVTNRNWESMLSWSKERHRFGFQNPSAEVGHGDIEGVKYTKPGVSELDYANMHPADRRELVKHRDFEASPNIDTEQMRIDEVDPNNRAEALVEREQGRPYKDQGPSSKSYQAEQKDAFTTPSENWEKKSQKHKQVVPSILTAEGEYTRTGTAPTETATVGKGGTIDRKITGGSKKPDRAVFQDTDRTSLLTARGKPVLKGSNVEGYLTSKGPQALGSSWSDIYGAGIQSQPEGFQDAADADLAGEDTPFEEESKSRALVNQAETSISTSIDPADARNVEVKRATEERLTELTKTWKSDPKSAEGVKARQQALGELLTQEVQDASKSTLDYSPDTDPSTAYSYKKVPRIGGTSEASMLTQLTHPEVKPTEAPPRLVRQQIEGGKVDLTSEQRVTKEAARRFAKAKPGFTGEAVVESIKLRRDPYTTLTQGLQIKPRSWDKTQPIVGRAKVPSEEDLKKFQQYTEESYTVKREAARSLENPNRNVASTGPTPIKTTLTSSETAAPPIKVSRSDPAKQQFKKNLQSALNISPEKVRAKTRAQQKQVRATALTSKTAVAGKALGVAGIGLTFAAAATEASSKYPTLKPSNLAVTAGQQALGPRAAQYVFGGGIPKDQTPAQRKYGQISATVKPVTPKYRAASATPEQFAEAKAQRGGVTPYHSVLNWFKSLANKQEKQVVLSPRLGQRRR